MATVRDLPAPPPAAGAATPSPGRPPECGSSPWPWDWAHMGPGDAAQMWEALGDFVAYLDARYAWTCEQLIPACWAEHGALVEELTTLFWSRHAAFEGDKPTIEAAQAWHHHYLPGFYQRLRWWLGENGSSCRAGQHPAQSPASEVNQAAAAARCVERRRTLISDDVAERTRPGAI